jgi:hypothetical protein
MTANLSKQLSSMVDIAPTCKGYTLKTIRGSKAKDKKQLEAGSVIW